MKVLFFFKSDFSSIPLGILTLSSVLENNGHECDFIDLKFENDFLTKISKTKPDVIAFSVVSFDWKYYQQINLTIKNNFSVFSIFGGPHCTVKPEFINEEGVDAICIGEGENALLELVTKLENKEDYSKIENLWIKKDGKIIKNEIRPLISDLDTIPFPDYNLLSKYPFYKNHGTYYIMTSRGCPYNCPYCINHFYRQLYNGKGKYVRKRSIANVIEELLIFKNTYKAKLIIFNDDIFTLDKNWLYEFSTEYIDKIGLKFEAYVRVDGVDEEIIKTLSKMGCVTVYFGIESGNKEIRYQVLKRKITNEQIIETSLLFKKYSIKTLSFNMLGLPGESIENAFETLYINIKSKVTYPMCFMFQPFPNIELTKYALENNFLDNDNDLFNKSLIQGSGHIKSKDKDKIHRLHYLFIVGIKLPFLMPLIKALIKLPFNLLYRGILHLSRAYILIFIIYRPSLKPLVVYYFTKPIKFIKTLFS